MRLCHAAAVLLAALAAAGCGAGAGEAPEGVSLTVTRDFGARELLARASAPAGGSETVLRLLQRNAEVETRYGGGFVQAIGGVEGGGRGGRQVDWFFYVNGVESSVGSAEARVRAGQRIWWDHHDWSTAMRVPAVVGSFPEPFLSGAGEGRLPVRVECSDGESRPCEAVTGELVDLGVPAARGDVSLSMADETLRVLVGPWSALRRLEDAARQIDAGPKASGVFATFSGDGRELSVLTPEGRVAETFGAGAGLVAATAVEGRQPVWFVTGTDEAGVAAAADAFDESTLARTFAVAVAEGRAVRAPAVEAAR